HGAKKINRPGISHTHWLERRNSTTAVTKIATPGTIAVYLLPIPRPSAIPAATIQWLWYLRNARVMSAAAATRLDAAMVSVARERDCVAKMRDRKSTRLNSSHGSISYA